VRTQPRRNSPRRAATDYSKFNHSSAKHLSRDCNSCHVIRSLDKPDIADFPDHPSCVECHRGQFFRGGRPAICSNCHTTTGPRSAARFAFPKPNEPAEFAEVFPHSAHLKPTSLIQFRRHLGEKITTTDSCRYCHKVDGRPFKQEIAATRTTAAAATVPAATPAALTLPAGTFMTTPTSHATCFLCHGLKGVEGREQEPLSTQCASCHRNTAAPPAPGPKPPVATSPATSTPQPTAAQAANPAQGRGAPVVAPLIIPASLARLSTTFGIARPARVSPKFVHEMDSTKKRTNEEGQEVPINCTQCHAAVRKAATLEVLKLKESQVRLLTCATSDCHAAVSGVAQLRLSVFRELRERGKDPKFDCALCHAPPVSVSEVPCGHYATVYESAAREKKNTRGIEQATPPRCQDAIKKDG